MTAPVLAPAPPPGRKALVVLVVWAAIAVGIGYTQFLARLPVPPPAVALALTAVSLVIWRIRAVRRHVERLGPGPLVAFHFTRALAGAYFLWLVAQGVFPPEFGSVAGWGDLTVAALAVPVLLFCCPPRTGVQETMLLGWNAVGLFDIVLVLSLGIRMFLADPTLAEPFTRLPLALLPTMIVPLVIASHIVLFVSPQTRRQEGSP